ncbi:hypothetical protein CEXT_436421 [Caerostris extrusa]|uniref:Uncharacterized protein n=1 Tax=Caerostris extrusa TaxID=172846 RepID=A0AAV4QRN8_CAEEX|nr:hypothetical protein CEXT_436421 [Caerostris extrusa]
MRAGLKWFGRNLKARATYREGFKNELPSLCHKVPLSPGLLCGSPPNDKSWSCSSILARYFLPAKFIHEFATEQIIL